MHIICTLYAHDGVCFPDTLYFGVSIANPLSSIVHQIRANTANTIENFLWLRSISFVPSLASLVSLASLASLA